MSRIGRLPIHVPAGVTVDIDDANLVTVKGPKGTLSQKVDPSITVKSEAGVITVERHSEDKDHRAKHGLYRALIHNMVVGNKAALNECVAPAENAWSWQVTVSKATNTGSNNADVAFAALANGGTGCVALTPTFDKIGK